MFRPYRDGAGKSIPVSRNRRDFPIRAGHSGTFRQQSRGRFSFPPAAPPIRRPGPAGSGQDACHSRQNRPFVPSPVARLPDAVPRGTCLIGVFGDELVGIMTLRPERPRPHGTKIRNQRPARSGTRADRSALRGLCPRFPASRPASRAADDRARPAAILRAHRRHRGRYRGLAWPDGFRLWRGADARAGAGRDGGGGAFGHGHRQPYPRRPQRAEILHRHGGDHEGR